MQQEQCQQIITVLKVNTLNVYIINIKIIINNIITVFNIVIILCHPN
jgi:hypothetical protein